MDESEKKQNLFEIFLLKKDIVKHLLPAMEDIAQRAATVFHKDLRKIERQHNFFFYEMCLNVTQSANTLGYLSDCVIREPLVFKNAVREVIHLTVTTLLRNDKIDLSQIIVSVVPSTLPGAGECVVYTQGLCSFRGVLFEHALPKKYTRGSVWECENHTDEDPYFIDGLPNKVAICSICNSDLTENVQNRSTGDLILAKFINVQALQMSRIRKTYAAILVKLTEVNSDLLELGSVYNLTGIQTQDGFEAWNCERYIPQPIPIAKTNPILALCASLAHSPWMFTYALATQLARLHYCATSYMHLKMGLLLSLASHNPRSNFSSIPVLALGEGTAEAAQLMQCASRYAARCVYPTYGQPVLMHARKDEWLEAGPLLLAQGGVCALGDWDKYNRAEKLGYNIRAAMESGNTNLDGSTMPLRCAVWTYWRRPTTPKEKQQLQAIVNVFGMPFLTDSHDNYESDVDFLFARYMPDYRPEPSAITESHMRDFLQAINEYDVTLNDEAQTLIKHYFVASRRYRPTGLPVRAIGLLTGLTEAHARLNLRQYALIEDVVAAIALYEGSIQRVYGICDLSTPAPLKYVTDIAQVDSEMRKFESWLQSYVATARTIP